MIWPNAHYHTVEKTVAGYDSHEKAETVATLLREGGATVEVVPTPDGVDDNGSIKYSFLVVVKLTIVTTQETLVW